MKHKNSVWHFAETKCGVVRSFSRGEVILTPVFELRLLCKMLDFIVRSTVKFDIWHSERNSTEKTAVDIT